MVKSISECKDISEVLETIRHLTRELNDIPGVTAGMTVDCPIDRKPCDRELKVCCSCERAGKVVKGDLDR